MRKRLVVIGLLLICALAVTGRRRMFSDVPSICYSIPLDNWLLRWWYGCPSGDAAGGGGSGAS